MTCIHTTPLASFHLQFSTDNVGWPALFHRNTGGGDSGEISKASEQANRRYFAPGKGRRDVFLWIKTISVASDDLLKNWNPRRMTCKLASLRLQAQRRMTCALASLGLLYSVRWPAGTSIFLFKNNRLQTS